MTTSRVWQTLHLQKADLIETANKDIDDVAIVSGTLGKVVIELVMLVSLPPWWIRYELP